MISPKICHCIHYQNMSKYVTVSTINTWDTIYVTVSNTWAKKDTVTSYFTKYTLCSGSSHHFLVPCLVLIHLGEIYSSTTYAYVRCSLSLLRWEQFTECTRVSSSQIALQSHCNYYLQYCNPSSCHLFQRTAQLG